MMKIVFFCITALSYLLTSSFGSVSQDVLVYSHEDLVVRLDPTRNYALTGLTHGGKGVEFISEPTATASRFLWLLFVRDADGLVYELNAASAESARHEVNEEGLTVIWSGVSADGLEGQLEVSVKITPSQGDSKTFWDLEVSGEVSGELWQVDFPRIQGIRPLPAAQMTLPYVMGMLVQNPVGHYIENDELQSHQQGGETVSIRGGRRTLPMPGRLSMQYWAYWSTPENREPELAKKEGYLPEPGWMMDRSDAAALYFSVEDGEFHSKNFIWDTADEANHMAWFVEQQPGLQKWPTEPGMRSIDYRLPYSVVVAAYTGDYHEAAELYHDWAKDQLWTRRGTIDEWSDEMPEPGSKELDLWVPNWFRNIGFWWKGYHEAAKIVPEWAAYREWLKVPMASHYYRYYLHPFDRRIEVPPIFKHGRAEVKV